ncbi:hypothetical protein [Chryseobacterium sp. JK1]|uniref:hypothetical protein n=1 Tax=Chryseobacterium sp. JK1 TaxID=874294 RepID=UPI003D688A0B
MKSRIIMMSSQALSKGKGYYHSVVTKTAYLYLPLFAVIVLVCTIFEKLRFILYCTVVGASYTFILNQLKKKSIDIEFSSDHIALDSCIIPIEDIQSYYLSLPLNQLLMLRIKTKNKDIPIYIDKDLKTVIESFFEKHSIRPLKEGYDNYLKYGHLIMPFAGLFICGFVYSIYNCFKYS